MFSAQTRIPRKKTGIDDLLDLLPEKLSTASVNKLKKLFTDATADMKEVSDFNCAIQDQSESLLDRLERAENVCKEAMQLNIREMEGACKLKVALESWLVKR